MDGLPYRSDKKTFLQSVFSNEGMNKTAPQETRSDESISEHATPSRFTDTARFFSHLISAPFDVQIRPRHEFLGHLQYEAIPNKLGYYGGRI